MACPAHQTHRRRVSNIPHADERTLNMTCLAYARMLIEIDLKLLLIRVVYIGSTTGEGEVYEIVNKGHLAYYSKCQIQGHNLAECHKAKQSAPRETGAPGFGPKAGLPQREQSKIRAKVFREWGEMDDARAETKSAVKDPTEEVVPVSPTPRSLHHTDQSMGLDDNPFKVLEDLPNEDNVPEASCQSNSQKSPAPHRLNSTEEDLAVAGNEDWTTVNKVKPKTTKKKTKEKIASPDQPTPEIAATPTPSETPLPSQPPAEEGIAEQDQPKTPVEGPSHLAVVEDGKEPNPRLDPHSAEHGSIAPLEPPDEQEVSDFPKPRSYLRKKIKDTGLEVEDDLSSKASKIGRPKKAKAKASSSLAAASTPPPPTLPND
uniref:Uncharacterized protein n=1 Tax=Kalanchoe fedtschenkoi TaxID=63787 RepID=A0A7N0RB66_KALFE